jgi:glycosyltransferase involved in cell wall biosynthesis
MSVSILILTLNEEINLRGYLESVSWSDDIVVFDSYSSDHTIENTKAAGARVVSRKFDNYASQRNTDLNDVEYKHPWVLMIDADERVSEELGTEIEQTLACSDEETTLLPDAAKGFFSWLVAEKEQRLSNMVWEAV